jgi:hypothetical protein
VSYRIVFDITQAGLKNWPGPAFGLLFVAFGIVLVRHLSRAPGWWAAHRFALGAFGFLFIGFALLCTAAEVFFSHAEYERFRTAFENGEFSVVEGVVTEFRPETLGNKLERFCVQNKCFQYSESLVTAGFNDSNLWGGPIRMGLPVRVSYVGHTIVKLEVKR